MEHYGRQNNAPQNEHILSFRTCNYVRLHDKGALRLLIVDLKVGRFFWII